MTDARNTTNHANPGKRDQARDAARRTAETLEANPLGIVVGGLAVGVLAGALIPRSQKEKELLAPVGKRLGETVTTAVSTAKDQARSELESRGFTKDAAQEQVKNLLGGLGKAATSAGQAAAKSATGKADGGTDDMGAGAGVQQQDQFGQA